MPSSLRCQSSFRVIAPEVFELLTRGRVATLGTIAPDGSPHLVPIVFAFDGRDLVTAVDSKPKTSPRLARLANIRREPRVSVLVHHYSENWQELWWVRADGTARIEDSGPTYQRALDALRARYVQYRETRIEGPVIRISLEQARAWRAVES